MIDVTIISGDEEYTVQMECVPRLEEWVRVPNQEELVQVENVTWEVKSQYTPFEQTTWMVIITLDV